MNRKKLEEEELKKKLANSQISENKKPETPKQPPIKNPPSHSQTKYAKQEEDNNKRFIETTNKLQEYEIKQRIKNSQNPINKKIETAENSLLKLHL